jgi:L-seryl-tRNA(Ser) seleniumtransferase
VIAAYQRGELERIPVQAMLRLSPEALEARIVGWQRALGALAVRTRLVTTSAAAGGGTLAEEPLPSRALLLETDSAEALTRALRTGDPAVLPRIESGAVLLDARTVLSDEDEPLIAALRAALER